MNNLESRTQQAVVRWFKYAHAGLGVPSERLLYAVPNAGKRTRANSSRMIAEGLRAGVPDLFLAVARGGKHGLYVEMKTPTGKISADQFLMLEQLSLQGYSCHVCRSLNEAVDTITAYLKQRP